MPLRSFLFAPGNHPRRVEKALTLDTDAVILDLEDGVGAAAKDTARAALAASRLDPARVIVRISAAGSEVTSVRRIAR